MLSFFPEFLLSHPFARKEAKGWGTEIEGSEELWAKTSNSPRVGAGGLIGVPGR